MKNILILALLIVFTSCKNEEQKEEQLKNFIIELENDEFYQKYPDLKDETIANYTEKLFGEKKANGGRIGLKGGSILNFIKNMTMNKKSPLQFGKDYLKNVNVNQIHLLLINKADYNIYHKLINWRY